MNASSIHRRPFTTWLRGATASLRQRLTGLSILALGAALLVGCAGTPLKPQPPEVTVKSVRPVGISLTEQTLMFTLSVNNPNSFSLPIEAVDFVARLSDQQIASGTSVQSTTIPAKGTGLLEVEVRTKLSDVLDKFRQLMTGGGLKLNYGLEGNVKVKDRDAAFPFQLKGDLAKMLQNRA